MAGMVQDLEPNPARMQAAAIEARDAREGQCYGSRDLGELELGPFATQHPRFIGPPAGDLTGDGFDDLIFGGAFSDARNNAKPDAGESHTVYGGNLSGSVTVAPNEYYVGNSAANTVVSRGNAWTIVGNGGADVLRSGRGDDLFAVSPEVLGL